MNEHARLMKMRQVCAGWKSGGAYAFARALEVLKHQGWLRARAQAVVTHDRALREFDELVRKAKDA